MRGDSTKMVCKELNGWRRVMSVSEYRSFRTLGRFCAKLCTDRNDWAAFCLGPAWSITNYDHKWWTINIGVLLQGALTQNGKGVHFFTARSQITYVYRVTAFVQHPSQIAHCAQLIPVKVARRLHNQQLKACECCGSPHHLRLVYVWTISRGAASQCINWTFEAWSWGRFDIRVWGVGAELFVIEADIQRLYRVVLLEGLHWMFDIVWWCFDASQMFHATMSPRQELQKHPQKIMLIFWGIVDPGVPL